MFVPKDGSTLYKSVNSNEQEAVTEPTTTAKLYREPGFTNFLSRFEDSEDLDVSGGNVREIQRRFEVFKQMPEVVKSLQGVVSEKVFKDLGLVPTAEDMTAIETAVSEKVFKDKDFEYLNTLQNQIIEYKTLPAKIKEMERRLPELGDRDYLQREGFKLGRQTVDQEDKVAGIEQNKEGVVKAKEATAIAKNLETQFSSAEKQLVREAESVLVEAFHSLKQLDVTAKKLAAAEKKLPEASRVTVPNVGDLKNKFARTAALSGTPKAFLTELIKLGLASSLEQAQQTQSDACEKIIAGLQKQMKPKRGKPPVKAKPEFVAALGEFRQIQTEVNAVHVSGSWEQTIAVLSDDQIQIKRAEKGFQTLQKEPANMHERYAVQSALEELQTRSFAGLIRLSSGDLSRLSEIQRDLAGSPGKQEGTEMLVSYSSKNILQKAIGFASGGFSSQNPETKLQAESKNEQKHLTTLRRQQQEVLGRIKSIDDAKVAIADRKADLEAAKKNLFSGLEIVKKTMLSVRAQAESNIIKKFETGNLKEVIAAGDLITKLATAREHQPELYGDMDSDTDADRVFKGMHLRELKDKFAQILSDKVQADVLRTLRKLTENNVSLDTVTVKLKSFEQQLGPLAQTEQYKKAKVEALKNAASRNSKLSKSKKLSLRILLNESVQVIASRNTQTVNLFALPRAA